MVLQENINGVSPLMAAARDGLTPIVGKLLEAGADSTQIDEFGRTAESIATEKDHPETAALLAEWAQTHPPPPERQCQLAEGEAAGAGEPAGSPSSSLHSSSSAANGKDGAKTSAAIRDDLPSSIETKIDMALKLPPQGGVAMVRRRLAQGQSGLPRLSVPRDVDRAIESRGDTSKFAATVEARLQFFELYRQQHDWYDKVLNIPRNVP